MNTTTLITTAQALMADHKGLLAMDESNPTCNKRFAKYGIPQTPDYRLAYREMLISAPRLRESVSGVILYDETIRQQTSTGLAFVKAVEAAGMIAGIKVDAGVSDLAGHAGEKITGGLDGLRERLVEYAHMGARFAKWRAVIGIDAVLPTQACIEANGHALARYAALCQEAGLVPIVEPEVLLDGNHSLQRCQQVTESVLRELFRQLGCQQVLLEGLLLKPAMVLPGLDSPVQDSVVAVAEATVQSLLRTVPAAVAGIAFLSGGQSAELATARLNAINGLERSRVPWPLTFSFSRAIQLPALELWRGQAAMVAAAQHALVHRAACNRAARRGEYTAAYDAVPPAPLDSSGT